MDQFSESRAGRAQVLARFKLAPGDRRILLDGCVRDIVVALAGGTARMSTTVVISAERGTADVKCGHRECKAFMATLAKPRKQR
jgi:hypothetical protein